MSKPKVFSSHNFVVMRFLEKALFLNSFKYYLLSITYFGGIIPLLYMCISMSCTTHICTKQLFTSVFTMLFL